MSTKTFNHPIRVYIEDTDAAGIVYHPNYLKFFERARTEMLRENRFTKTSLEKEYGLRFVIKDIQITFKKTAFMDDLLDVKTSLESHTPTRLCFSQEIYRSQKAIASAKVTVVCVDHVYKPARLPNMLLTSLGGIANPLKISEDLASL